MFILTKNKVIKTYIFIVQWLEPFWPIITVIFSSNSLFSLSISVNLSKLPYKSFINCDVKLSTFKHHLFFRFITYVPKSLGLNHLDRSFYLSNLFIVKILQLVEPFSMQKFVRNWRLSVHFI